MSSTAPEQTLSAQEVCVDCQPDPQANGPSVKAKNEEVKEDLMDPTTFVPPIDLSATDGVPTPLVVIEYCQRCKFGLRANWIQQELLSTFTPTSSSTPSASIASVLVIPKIEDASAGRFRIYLLPPPSEIATETSLHKYKAGLVLVWDRKVQSGFPEMRILKQKIRDLINPEFGLGHSDKK